MEAKEAKQLSDEHQETETQVEAILRKIEVAARSGSYRLVVDLDFYQQKSLIVDDLLSMGYRVLRKKDTIEGTTLGIYWSSDD